MAERYQRLANQKPISLAGCKNVRDWLPAYELQPFCRDQSGALNSMIKKLNAISVLSILLTSYICT